MNKTFIYLVFLALLLYYLFFTDSGKSTMEYFSLNTKSVYWDVFQRMYPEILDTINGNGLSIEESQALAVVLKESYNDCLTKNNSSVIGDDGHSIGFMQVSLPALTDVNSQYGFNYKISDLYNEKINILVGCCYLNLCYLSATRQTSDRAVWLAFKKYNGGIGQSLTSTNVMASAYADKAFEYYQKFKEYV